MDDLLADFVAESREMLEALAGEIVAWEAEPTDRSRLDAIFRFFHTVKGNCGFFDFPRLEALSHAAEDVLSDVRAGRRQPDEALVNAVLAVIDRIAAMIEAIETGEEFPEGGDEELIAALEGTGEVPGSVPAMQVKNEPANSERSSGGPRSIRLPVELLDRIMSGVSDMVLARNDLLRRIHEMGEETGLEAPFNRLSAILNDVRDAITHTRMQRIENLFAAFPRMVRDLAADLGRQVMVEMESGDVELDREMIELIRDPMVHVIRNAIDHGIETPAERLEAGKREIGLLTISARQTGNEILVGIIDDGRGVNSARLVEKAIAAGIITAEQAEAMTPRERNQLMCEPGISTAGEVTAVSGRGVGMDVVRANLEKIGGSIIIDSTPGAGTRIMLKVPLTLSIVPSITVAVGEQKFALPRSYVEEIVRGGTEEADMARVGGQMLVTIRDKRVPCVALGDVLRIAEEDRGSANTLVVMRLVGGDRFAVAVDRIHDHEELVVKPIAPALMKTGFYVGTTQLDDGSPVLMLDVAGIAREAGLIREVERVANSEVEQATRRKIDLGLPALLFVGFDGQRRVIPMSTVDRVEKAKASAVRISGGEAQVVLEERILPLVGLFGQDLPEERIEFFRLSDGHCEIAYAFREMIDISRIEGELAEARSGEAIAGIALIEGEPVEVLDCHKLFALYGVAPRSKDQPVCRIPSGDRWFQDFLKPMVEAAGYRVVSEADTAAKADVEIAAAEASAKPGGNAIRIRSTEEATPDTEGSIYRYDRDALVAALRDATKGKAA
ncbi:MAG TPA: chemotaxis protein CheA [Sphingomonadaceae bacterium]|nr:chemotaxis protein CheA [Sphingomonadaceae bacterium]